MNFAHWIFLAIRDAVSVLVMFAAVVVAAVFEAVSKVLFGLLRLAGVRHKKTLFLVVNHRV